MTQEEHKKRHIELHKSLDELFADFIRHNPNKKSFLETPIKKLMEWSYKQTISPTSESLSRAKNN